MRDRFEMILFDLGGVLVELGGVSYMRAWSALSFDEDELWRLWLESPAVRGFERGEIDTATFAAAVIEEFQLSVDAGVFLDAFDRFVMDPFPGAEALLEYLRDQVLLVSLSNTNSVHWARVGSSTGIARHFHHNYPSHETRRIKPDREAFEHIIDQHAVDPARILFLDDNRINVEAAAACGIYAVRVAGFRDAVEQLVALGALDREALPSTVSE